MRDPLEPFLPYRDRIVNALAVVTLVVYLPFGINNFIQGRVLLGFAGLVFIGILVIDAVAISIARPMPIPLWTLVLPVILSMVAALLEPHYPALAWTYPVILFFYFILPQRTANIVSAALVFSVSGVAWFVLEPALTARLFATLFLTALLVNIFVGVIGDLYRQLQEQATTDPLTHAFNRRHMDTVLGEAVERRARGEAAPSLVLIDIDHFKEVNDRFGHAAGDAVLCAVAATVRARSRKVDRLFRSGGEEFVLYLPATGLEGAATVAEEVRRAVAAESLPDGQALTVSAGVSELQPDETVEAWLRRADAALYEAKRTGRDRVVASGSGARHMAPA
jgi:diguanylate cyclase (GGDEF)-like protein